MTKRLLYILVFVLCAEFSSAQDVHFAQTGFIPQLINPAATGVFEGWERVTLSHRQQWLSLGSPYMTSQLSADFNLFKKDKGNSLAYLGGGIFFYNDIAGNGNMGTNQGGVSLAGIVNVTEFSTLSVGVQTSFAQRSLNASKLTWGNQFSGDGFDPSISSNESTGMVSFVYPDFSTGIHYRANFYKNNLVRKEKIIIYAGASYQHFTKPQLNFRNGSSESLHEKYVFNVGGSLDIPNSKWTLDPSFVYFIQQKNKEMLIGMDAKMRLKNGSKYTGINVDTYVGGGVIVRSKDAISPHVIVEFKSFKIGLNYEIALSQLSQAGANSLELSLQWANLNTSLFKTRRSKGYKKPNSGM